MSGLQRDIQVGPSRGALTHRRMLTASVRRILAGAEHLALPANQMHLPADRIVPVDGCFEWNAMKVISRVGSETRQR
jgi:hypothetical protein